MKVLTHLTMIFSFAFSLSGGAKEPIAANSLNKNITSCPATPAATLPQTQGSLTDQATIFFSSLFDTQSWPARWQCGEWSSFHGWLYIASDVAIGCAYFLIPLILWLILYKRKQPIPLRFIVLLFILFILACGLTHIIDASMFWWPAYRFNALIRFATAIVSITTVFALVQVIPEMLLLQSTESLEKIVAERTVTLLDLNKRLNQEIEARKQSEEKLAREKDLLRILIDNLPDYIYVKDTASRHLINNKANVALIGANSEGETLGRTVADFFGFEVAQKYIEDDKKVMASGKALHHAEEMIITKNGTKRWLLTTKVPLRDEQNKVTGLIGISRDITERKLTELKLADSENQYRSLFESAAVGNLVVDKDGNIVAINARMEEMFGYQKGELTGKKVEELIPDAIRGIHITHRITYNAQPKRRTMGESMDLFAKRKDGSTFPVEISLNYYYIEDDLRVAAFVIDITHRKEAEQKLAVSEQRFRALIENSFDIISLYSEKLDIIYVSPSFERVTGFSLKERKNSARMDVIHPEELEKTKQLITTVLSKPGVPIPFQTRLRHKDGHYFWVEGVMTNLLQDENVQAIVSNYRDISERKEAENRLAASEERFRTLIENSTDAIALTDEKFIIFYQSPWAEKMTGYTLEERKKIPGLSLVHPDDRDDVIELFSFLLRNEGHSTPFQCRFLHKKGHYIWVEGMMINRLHDKSVNAIVANYREITERKEAEAQILKLNAELEERVLLRTSELETANKELEAFTYSVSHDLRAPLRSINGYGKILIEDFADKLDEKGIKTIDTIINNARKMGQLIDDLLDFSRLGRAEVRKSNVNMDELVKEVLTEMDTNGVPLPLIHIGELKPAWGDARLIKQVWINLISNAIKYSSGKEKPQVEIGMTEQDNRQIYFVKDNGTGFDMKYYHKLFGVFQRLHKYEEFAGTGVGLAIVHRILSRHGGKIWADATLGEGATFYFSLSS